MGYTPEKRREYDREYKRRKREESREQRGLSASMRSLLEEIVDGQEILIDIMSDIAEKLDKIGVQHLSNLEEVGQKVGHEMSKQLDSTDVQKSPTFEHDLDTVGQEVGQEPVQKVGQKLDTKVVGSRSSNINKTTTTTTNSVDSERRERVRELSESLPSANGAQAGKSYVFVKCPYEEMIGEADIRQMAQKLVKYQDSMGSVGWVRKLLREGYHAVPGLSEPELRRGIAQYFHAIETQRDKIKNVSAWSVKTFPSVLENLAAG